MLKQTLMVLALTWATGTQAKVTLPAWMTSNMVLQQQRQITINGTANKGKKVKVTTGWDGHQQTVMADSDGRFEVTISTPAAGGPYTLTFNDGKALTLDNVLVGEVWFCSGQSNMEMPVEGWGNVLNHQQEVSNANYPNIRLLQVDKKTAVSPISDFTAAGGGWQECSPQSVPEFSALAYFFARNLWQNLNIPIGVVNSSWGGTPAEAWTSLPMVRLVEGFGQQVELLDKYADDQQGMQSAYEQQLADWHQRFRYADKGFEGGNPVWAATQTDDADWSTMQLPGQWESSVLPGFDGIVWFRYALDIPSAWAGKEVTLHLGMIDDEDLTYWNGRQIAQGWGFNQQRAYTVPTADVKGGKTVLAIRVTDGGGEGGINGDPSDMYAEQDGQRIALAGNWKYNIGANLKQIGAQPVSPSGSSSFPSVLYNAMVHPFISMPIAGTIWYQGEANEAKPEQYGTLFPAMIQDWRERWGSDFPFYFVQLANYHQQLAVDTIGTWAALRESQAKALKLQNTGMVVNIDGGTAGDIHPKDKQEVGRRMALLALKRTYGKDIDDSAPTYKDYKILGDKVEIKMQPTTEQCQKPVNPIVVKGDKVAGFTIAGADHQWHEADAVVNGNLIYVSSPSVPHPLAVRYAWSDNPPISLYGTNGLPVAPFRTDNW